MGGPKWASPQFNPLTLAPLDSPPGGALVPPNGLRGSWGGAVVNLIANDTGNSGPGPAQVNLPGSFPGWLSSPVSPFRRAGPPPKSNFAVWAGALRSPLVLGQVSGGNGAALRARPCKMAVPLAVPQNRAASGRAGRAGRRPGTTGSLVLRRMDRRGTRAAAAPRSGGGYF